ncbi:MAG: GAF domain-containing protein [Candidatus Dormibacteraeota bacterium]|uniref:GAF domain-containing protein n=1 Tax=Candidatus Dormiibacter inghamiae TaxID=3127013 RepID=A0A934KET4_9BACT|nr:GAF domain-containing protein [Candidatus Dormibacteraeota bacterium]MBJ7606353.1 GAF domain-containing protein [Candidatus Dormibacteraeota bacterium]
MSPSSESASPSLTDVLRSVLADMKRASGADIISLVLYDQDARRYYGPHVIGLSQDSLRDSLTDMQSQLDRYLADEAGGKAPDDLRVTHYGSTAWLTVRRQTLVAKDAPSEIDSTFIRRHHVLSTVGLPLLAEERLVGLLYLNFCADPAAPAPAAGSRTPDKAAVAELERKAREAAVRIRSVLTRTQRAAVDSVGRLTRLLTAAADDAGAAGAGLRRQLSIALADLLLASDLDAAAIYEIGPRSGGLDLVTAHAPAAVPVRLEVPAEIGDREAGVTTALATAMAPARLYPAGTFPLRVREEVAGYLVVMGRDPLASVRRAPTTDVLLGAAADLVGGALASRRLISTLADSNRLLGALSRMSSAMLRPGSSRQDVLNAVVIHLTDGSVPEFDFQFATMNLIEDQAERGLLVRMTAGAATSDTIAAAASEDAGGERGKALIPRWALQQERRLASTDVLAYVATSWQVALVGPVTKEPAGPDLVAGGIPDQVRWTEVPVVRADGESVTSVPAGLIGHPDAGELPPDGGAAPFTLSAEVFEAGGHADLVRMFLPVGLESGARATGVLEVGYHRSHRRRPDWSQIEALRAATFQVGLAVETSRLYEDARRHAEQLELSADVSEAIASTIDLEQTLRLVARNLVRLVDASVCQIALSEEDGEGWYGAAASDREEAWQRWRGERQDHSFLFEVIDRGLPVAIEDVSASELVPATYVEAFAVRSLLALPLVADGKTIGAAVLAQREQTRNFTAEEVQRAQGLAHQAAVAIKNARLHALAEEERHIQKDFILIGFGQWGQKAYHHLQTLKQFFNFRLHVVERDAPGAHERLQEKEEEVRANGDVFYWDSDANPARAQLERELEASCYIITYIATPAATHLPTLARYYDLSDVILIEKPLGAPPEDYRRFLDQAPGGCELVAADHYYFKLEVRLLQLLLTEERTLRDFLDSVEEIRIEILEAQALTGAAADIGVVADLIPHAFAIVSLFTPIDRIELDVAAPLLIGRHEPLQGQRETYARMNATFPYLGRSVRLVIDVGKGVEDAKWIKLSGEHRLSGRSPFYKFDFARGEAIDGTQSTVRAAVRKIREPGVPDNAHLNMLRHVVEKRHPAVGILSIREAIRANVRIRELEAMAGQLLERDEWSPYALNTRPQFAGGPALNEPDGAEPARATPQERARARA